MEQMMKQCWNTKKYKYNDNHKNEITIEKQINNSTNNNNKDKRFIIIDHDVGKGEILV